MRANKAAIISIFILKLIVLVHSNHFYSGVAGGKISDRKLVNIVQHLAARHFPYELAKLKNRAKTREVHSVECRSRSKCPSWLRYSQDGSEDNEK